MESKDLKKIERNSRTKAVSSPAPAQQRKQEPIVTVTIDYGLCEGCGACAEMYPELFEIRDEKAWVVNQEQFDAVTYKKNPVICPYRAIIIE